jgi:pimeloyl-ACP methyl ester carboxylesterase
MTTSRRGSTMLRSRTMIALALVAAVLVGLFVWNDRVVRRIEAAHPRRGELIAVEGGRLNLMRRDPLGIPRATVLLLHGASGNLADMMEPLGDRLVAQGFRVVAVDRPGHGWSERIEGSASPALQARRIRSALESIGLHQAIVVGHSWSGALAENFLLDQPDFTQGAVLVAPVTHPWPGGIDWHYRLATLPVLGDIFARFVVPVGGSATIEAGVAGVFAPQSPPPDYVARTGAALVLRPAEYLANAEDVAGLKAFVTAQAPREPSIRQPVAIVAGDSDRIVTTPIHSPASRDAIPGATLTILPGVGHSVHWVDPAAVVAAVADVARRIEAQTLAARPDMSANAPSTSSQ